MKKAITFFAAFIISTSAATAQKVTTDANGNFVAVKADKKAKGDTTAIGKTFTAANGTVYPVFKVVKSGKLYAAVTSKAGRYYRKYLKVN